MSLVLDEYIRVLDAVRAEWPDLFRGYKGQPRTIEEIRFVSERLGLSMIPKPGDLLKAATKYLNEEKDPEPIALAVKSTPQVTKNDLPTSSGAGSW